MGSDLLKVLLDDSLTGDSQWRVLSANVLGNAPSMEDLRYWFETICEFDEVFRSYCATPLAIQEAPILVAGSGKESFKTFNVSTASALVAAAAGVPIVKGVAKSVSAVSGSLDVLESLGIHSITEPEQIGAAVKDHGIAFVDYRTFCPRFFRRYDGRFADLLVTSLFMPLLALCVKGIGFVYGLAAASLTEPAAQLIARSRQDLRRGVVVATEVAPGQMIDEFSRYGRSWQSRLVNGSVVTQVRANGVPEPSWFAAVAQRNNHSENGELFVKSLTAPEPCAAVELVLDNAALIIQVGLDVSYEDARRKAEECRGRAVQLLRSISATC